VDGDDVLPRAGEFGFTGALTANAYLGGWGIAECLRAGADIVVTGRVTDASLVVGPAAAHFGWGREDYDRLAGATAAGHVIECGAQATGGNYAFFTELPGVDRPGFPIAEIHADGSSVITKHPGTGGAVTVETVTAQLLYEIAGPRYYGPDVTTRFDTVTVADAGADRVRITGTHGEPPPPDVKVCLNTLAGFRNGVTFVLCGLDIDAKAEFAKRQLTAEVGGDGLEFALARTEHADADTEETASAFLHAAIRTADPLRAKGFSRACVELALSSYPGFTLTAPPEDGAPVGVYRPAFIPATAVEHTAVLPGGERIPIAAPTRTMPMADVEAVAAPEKPASGLTRDVPLGTVFGARSGDKGGDANVGVWARDDAGYRWLATELTVDRLRKLLPETENLAIDRHPLPNLRAVNFVVRGLLGDGVAASTRFDPQAKALGEWLRSRVVALPEELLA
jgi:hypothetical protein